MSNYKVNTILRDDFISQDTSTDYDVILHAIHQMITVYGVPDLLVYLRPTTPFRNDQILEYAIQLIASDSTITSLRSIELMSESAWKCFELTDHILQPIIGSHYQANLPNQLVKPTYKGNGYIDIVRPQYVLDHPGDLWGDRCHGFITEPVIEIDTPNELEYARWWISQAPLSLDDQGVENEGR